MKNLTCCLLASLIAFVMLGCKTTRGGSDLASSGDEQSGATSFKTVIFECYRVPLNSSAPRYKIMLDTSNHWFVVDEMGMYPATSNIVDGGEPFPKVATYTWTPIAGRSPNTIEVKTTSVGPDRRKEGGYKLYNASISLNGVTSTGNGQCSGRMDLDN